MVSRDDHLNITTPCWDSAVHIPPFIWLISLSPLTDPASTRVLLGQTRDLWAWSMHPSSKFFLWFITRLIKLSGFIKSLNATAALTSWEFSSDESQTSVRSFIHLRTWTPRLINSYYCASKILKSPSCSSSVLLGRLVSKVFWEWEFPYIFLNETCH